MFRLLVVWLGCLSGLAHSSPTLLNQLEHLERFLDKRQTESEVDTMKTAIGLLARHSLLTQFRIEEKTRTDGDSGLKQVRHRLEGTMSYNSDSVYGRSIAAIHDHANNIRTIGMGEYSVVLNGVEFRTRHNDYGVRMASTTSTDWQATENIPFPEVPPAVLEQPTVEDQVTEMREWFKAWRDQDHSERDYRPYFRPILCYLEGMWTLSGEALEESFESDRHFLDANSWFELEEKVRFLAYSGSKGAGENSAYLPRVIFNVTEDGMPQVAQWNYDILCHPLEDDVPLNRFKVVDDLSARMRNKIDLGRFERTRLARFQLNRVDEAFTSESIGRLEYLDSLMHQIPGKDNYGAEFEDRGIENYLYKEVDNHSVPLNAGYYHRNLFVGNRDAMGQQFRYRGFADQNIYMAMNSQEKVAGMKITVCTERRCNVIDQRWSYAIPLEIIYMTPLSRWNPYNIPYRGGNKLSEEFLRVTAGGRNGQSGNAFDGTNSKNFFQTPAEFYYSSASDSEVDRDPADTTPRGGIYVLDESGSEHLVVASGHRIFLPEINGLGIIRQRYPIMPVHAEGSILWKEIEALKELVMDPLSHGHLMYNPINAANFVGDSSYTYTYITLPSTRRTEQHVHEFTITQGQYNIMAQGGNITVTTETANGHAHTFLLYAVSGRLDRVRYYKCDNSDRVCWDGHLRPMTQVTEG